VGPQAFLIAFNSDSSGYLAGTQTTGAYINGLGSTVYNSLNTSDVGLPGSVGLSVGMGNCESELNCLSADAALCHDYYLRYLSRHVWIFEHGDADTITNNRYYTTIFSKLQ